LTTFRRAVHPFHLHLHTLLTSVVGFDGTVHASLNAWIASLLARKSHVLTDERFQHFVRILGNETPGYADHA
jgi:hypothetical protein